MDGFEDRMRIATVKAAFPAGEVGDALRLQAEAMWNACRDGEARDLAEDVCLKAARHAETAFREGAYTRSGSLEEWFSLPSLGLPELARRHEARVAAWSRQPFDEEEEARREEEEDRIVRLEEEGAYGRTLRFLPESADWLFVRFGRLPVSGRSVFGLAREDTEDGPDPWRQELGNMTHEAGVSVFRAHRHPDVPGAFVLIAPDFGLARYGVESDRSHLLSVMPDAEDMDGVEVFLVEGTPATCRGPDGTLRCELGSDGEYLITGKQARAVPLSLDDVWSSRQTRVKDLLVAAGRYLEDGRRPEI